MLHMCTCKDRGNKPTDKQRKKQGKKREYTKNTLTKKAKQGKTKHAKHIKGGKQPCYQTNGGCLRRKNVGLDRVSIVSLDYSIDDTQIHA